MEKILRRLLGEHIDLRVDPGAESDTIFADSSQLEQIIVNLAVNARDAMPKGGTLVIATAGGKDATRVELVVRDTGSGIDEITRARIFDPFFTTKPKGKGTGLGLATVLRIVRASNASIDVTSEVDQGTSFIVGFPTVATHAAAALKANVERPRGHETVLLAEDDDAVRRATSKLLERQGYVVIEARDGAEALSICKRLEENIDLLLTDVMMPKVNGPELVRRVALIRPELPVICMSGYTGEAAMKDLEARKVMLIHKPLMPDAFSRTLRNVLDEARARTDAHAKKNPGKDHSFPGPSSLHLP
jgi:two-component system cell cycle sensor histidine kinase/response regulator CckA